MVTKTKNNKPKSIGFYDSGIGGLTIVQSFLNLTDDVNFVYLADTQFLPLGQKTASQIRTRMEQVCSYLFQQCDLVVLVCNTASVNSIRYLQQQWLPQHFANKQVLGISKPILELLELQFSDLSTFNPNPTLAILCTQATAQSNFYQHEISQIGFKTSTWITSELATAIENQDYNQCRNILFQLKNQQIVIPNYILLACTHYPIIKELIESVFESSVVIDPSQYIAQKLVRYIENHTELAPDLESQQNFLTTGDSVDFDNKLSNFWTINNESTQIIL